MKVFSACRPARLGIGGFADKRKSLHAYGLAVDVVGIGGPCSIDAKRWHKIAQRNGVHGPYGPCNRAEFNHMAATQVHAIESGNPLRSAAMAADKNGDWSKVWKIADRTVLRKHYASLH